MMKKKRLMTMRTVEVARSELDRVREWLIDSVPADEYDTEKVVAWQKLKNFIDLAEKELKEVS